MHFRPLQELVPAAHGSKVLRRREMVFPAVLLPVAARPCRVRNGKMQISGMPREELRDQRRLSPAGGRGDDEEIARGEIAHSRFCTCSRTFSVSLLKSIT